MTRVCVLDLWYGIIGKDQRWNWAIHGLPSVIENVLTTSTVLTNPSLKPLFTSLSHNFGVGRSMIQLCHIAVFKLGKQWFVVANVIRIHYIIMWVMQGRRAVHSSLLSLNHDQRLSRNEHLDKGRSGFYKGSYSDFYKMWPNQRKAWVQ